MDPNKRTRLFSTIGIILIAGVIVFAGFRMVGAISLRINDWSFSPARWFGRGEETIDAAGPGGGPLVDLPIPAGLEEFTGVSTVGGWKVTLRPGPYDVSVRVSEGSLDDVTVGTDGDLLRLAVRSGLRPATGSLRATVTLPDLEHLEVDGAAEVMLDGFEVDRLFVDIEGAASVRAVGGRYDDLRVETDGAAGIDFSNSAVVDAAIDMDGASSMDITMAGGRLTGVLRGVGNVRYGGDIAAESVRVEGLGRVRER
jgi:hypothetical protein